MNLPVGGGELAIRADVDAGVVALRRIGGDVARFVMPAQDQLGARVNGKSSTTVQDRCLCAAVGDDGLDDLALQPVGPDEGERLRQQHHLGARIGGAANEGFTGVEVRLHVRGGTELNQSDGDGPGGLAHDPARSCSGWVQITGWPRYSSIAGRLKASSSDMKLMEMPSAPARPVRPMRCT